MIRLENYNNCKRIIFKNEREALKGDKSVTAMMLPENST